MSHVNYNTMYANAECLFTEKFPREMSQVSKYPCFMSLDFHGSSISCDFSWGLVINYGEGGYKMGNPRARNGQTG